MGSIEALKLFAELVVTPESTEGVMNPARFSTQTYAVEGEPDHTALIEAKSSRDLMLPGFADRVETRGIEIDKAIALMMLTSRGFGHPRYEAASLRVSFAEFEKYVLGAETADQMLSLGVIKEIIHDNVNGFVIDQNRFVTVPSETKIEITEIVRYYSLLGATLYLSADTIEDKYDFSSLFRVGSSLGAPPKDRLLLTKLDQNASSPTALKLWSFDNSAVSDSAIRRAAGQRAVITGADVLVKGLDAVLKAADEKVAEESRLKLVGDLQNINVDQILAPTTEDLAAQVDLTLQIVAAQLDLIDQIKKASEAGAVDDETIASVTDSRRSLIEKLNKDQAVTALANKWLSAAFTDESPEGQIAALLNSPEVLETNYGLVVSNLQTINRFVSLLNPELNR